MSGLHAYTLVKTDKGLIPASDIKINDMVYNNLNKPIRITCNSVTDNINNFILIKCNALGKNAPEHDLYITQGSTIIINGVDVVIDKLINGFSVININLDKCTAVYNLCTENKTFISVANIFVQSMNHN
jgi:hypothetical protein